MKHSKQSLGFRYPQNFDAYLRGQEADNALEPGATTDGSYTLPVGSESALEAEITKNGVIRSLASVVRSYDGPSHLMAAQSDDVAQFLGDGEALTTTRLKDDFRRISIDTRRLQCLTRVPVEFASDQSFDLENYIVKRMGRSFADAEDGGFLIGSGENEPQGILATVPVGVSVGSTSLSIDNLVNLYFSLDSDYRARGTWLMNDRTLCEIRKLHDSGNRYIFNDTNGTILGRPVRTSPYMPLIESGKRPILFGDFSYFCIILRAPASLKVLSELFASSNERGFLGTERLDGKLLRTGALKSLSVFVPPITDEDEIEDEDEDEEGESGSGSSGDENPGEDTPSASDDEESGSGASGSGSEESGSGSSEDDTDDQDDTGDEDDSGEGENQGSGSEQTGDGDQDDSGDNGQESGSGNSGSSGDSENEGQTGEGGQGDNSGDNSEEDNSEETPAGE